MYLFHKTIDGWDSWGQVFQSINVFRGVAREIQRRHNLPAEEITNLTPGTNAVFRTGDTVMKIYAPAESGITSDDTELIALLHAQAVGVAAPRVIAHGEIADKYVFPYIVMEYIPGEEARHVIHSYSPEQKTIFARHMREITAKLNVPLQGDTALNKVRDNIIDNSRWKIFPPEMRRGAVKYKSGVSSSGCVFVHGDLTGDNILVCGDGTPIAIDFGDSQMAPPDYELMPICFDLFRMDPIMMEAYFGNYRSDAFTRRLTGAALLHDYGGNGVEDCICRRLDVPISSVTSADELFRLIKLLLV